MRRIIQGQQFRRDFKRMKRRGKKIEKLYFVVAALAHDKELPTKLKPHKLTGQCGGFWECHVESDWLLIHMIIENEVRLVRTGTHADLFN